jgi:hypothetical protein
VLGFYVLARTMAAVQILAAAAGAATWRDRLTGGIVDILAALLPSLDRMTDTAWVLDGFGGASSGVAVLVPALVYVALLGGAAAFDLHRQNF